MTERPLIADAAFDMTGWLGGRGVDEQQNLKEGDCWMGRERNSRFKKAIYLSHSSFSHHHIIIIIIVYLVIINNNNNNYFSEEMCY